MPFAALSCPLALLTSLALIVLPVTTAAGADKPCSPAATDQGQVASVDEQGEITLADGRRLRLAGILMTDTAPSLIRDELASATEGQLHFHALSAKPDRWGRINAQILMPEAPEQKREGNVRPATLAGRAPGGAGAAMDLRGEAPYTLDAWLVDRGQARVAPGLFSPEPPAACLRFLLGREDLARRAGRGIWQGAATAIRPADDPQAILAEAGRFAVVEGVVASVGERKRVTYLNFGHEWTRDFTVTILKNSRTRLAQAGLVAADLKGRRVRVRGLVEDNRGPLIEVFASEQIEVVGAE
jgi:hypothetical protein